MSGRGGSTTRSFPTPSSFGTGRFASCRRSKNCTQHALWYIGGLVSCLNTLYGFGGATTTTAKTNLAQRTAFGTIGERVNQYVARLLSCVPADVDYEGAWDSFQSRGATEPLELVADLVECPASAGTCDPLDLLPQEWVDIISDSSRIFPSPPPGLERFFWFLRW